MKRMVININGKLVGFSEQIANFAVYMGYSLTIDRGNTTSKIVVWDGMSPLATLSPASNRAVTADSSRLLKEILDFAKGYDIDRAIISTVRDNIPGLEETLAERGISLLNLSAKLDLPIAIDYATPDTLGADRLAAAIGAWSLWPGREILIVDIGTAATYDRVTADGRYIGGNIAPGVGMRLRALRTFTAALPVVQSVGETPQFGFSTETAMRAGAIYGVVAEISYYRNQMPDDAVVVLTGGWSVDIAKHLDFPVEQHQLLVNQGLNCILNHIDRHCAHHADAESALR